MKTIHNLLRLCILSLMTIVAISSAEAKSIVFTLNSGTQIYYKISSDAPPRMVLYDNGTFTMNGKEYAFDDVKHFAYSATDYDGEIGTEDGIVSIDENGLSMKGDIRIYSLDGKLVSKGGELDNLKPGTYIISNGTTTLKLQKR